MLRTFNCGIGMIAIVRTGCGSKTSHWILTEAGETVTLLGEVIPAEGDHHVGLNGHVCRILHGEAMKRRVAILTSASIEQATLIEAAAAADFPAEMFS